MFRRYLSAEYVREVLVRFRIRAECVEVKGGCGVEMGRVLDDAIGIVDYCNEGSWKTEYVSFYIRNSHR